jgi:hypothetical protein
MTKEHIEADHNGRKLLGTMEIDHDLVTVRSEFGAKTVAIGQGPAKIIAGMVLRELYQAHLIATKSGS